MSAYDGRRGPADETPGPRTEGSTTTETIPAPAWARHGTDLSDKTVLVVGGAGGVGEEVVRVLLARGATAVATARTRAKLDDLAARVDDRRRGVGA